MWLMVVGILSLIIVALICVVCWLLPERKDYQKLRKMKMQEFGVLVCKHEGKKQQVNIAQVLEVLSVTQKLILERTGVNIYDLMRGEKECGNS